MIYVYIKKELAKFETDIRDLCLAFFTLQKITYIIESDTTDESIDTVGAKSCEPQIANDDIVVNDYYTGALSGDRLQIKSELKRQLYNYLSKLTGKTLLWGTLTGIRPVNIVTKIIEDLVGNPLLTDDYTRNELKKEYYISDLKANELIRIAKKEIEILNRPEVKDYKKSYSIYVGVPFCKSTCLYCSFTSFNIEKFSKYVDTYLEAVEKDFKNRIVSIGGKPLTLYIGGGTPTSLNEEQFENIKLISFDSYPS